MMERWYGKVAIVTGASSGIGAGVCEQLVQQGLQVAGVARRVDRINDRAKELNGKSSGKLYGLKCDLTKQEDIVNAFKWTKEHLGPVNILINNAGVSKEGSITEGNPADWEMILKTNLWGLAICTQEAVKQMRHTDANSHIVNVNSLAGHQVISGGNATFINFYSPSKFALRSLTQIVADEMKHLETKIKVTSISPGLVKTEMTEQYGCVNFDRRPHLQVKDVVDAILYILATPPNVLIRELIISHPHDMI